jgi:hypothetical protein
METTLLVVIASVLVGIGRLLYEIREGGKGE